MHMISILPSFSLATLWLLLCRFTLSPSLIPGERIVSGGPPKYGIPALTNPNMETAEVADHWLPDSSTISAMQADMRIKFTFDLITIQ